MASLGLSLAHAVDSKSTAAACVPRSPPSSRFFNPPSSFPSVGFKRSHFDTRREKLVFTSEFLNFGLENFSNALRKKTLDGRNYTGGRKFVVKAAVFDDLSTSLEKVWTSLKGQEKLTRENIKEPMREIRRALLEADVSLPVVRRFVRDVAEKAVGADVLRGVTPDQQLVKVVNDELVALMGGSFSDVVYSTTGPTTILMAGLQGVGKTTACAKLAAYFKKKGKSCMMIATDIYRPAAIDQLIKLGTQIETPVFSLGSDVSPPEIARRGVQEAKAKKVDIVIVDTAGRLQIDNSMMTELKKIKEVIKPTETFLVVDAMTGQEAASVVSAFNLEIGISAAILTKLDGDSRGGAALSIKEVSGKPIKFVGEGETMSSLEPFYPERMASRILGMGDIVSLVERAQEILVKEEAESIQKKIMEANFDFEDLLKQTKMIARMGSMSGFLKLLPGMNKITPQQIRDAEKSLKIMESMINSMTPKERKNPDLLANCPSRRRRIAKGSGRTQQQVQQLVLQLFQMRASMKNLSKMLQGGSIPGMPGMDMASMARKASPGTAKRKRSKSNFGELVSMSQEGKSKNTQNQNLSKTKSAASKGGFGA